MKVICNSGYILTHSFTAAMYATYVVAITDTLHIVRKWYMMEKIMFVPYSVVVVTVLVNIFTHNLFWFDSSGVYQRGKIFPILYISMMFYVLFSLFILIKYRKSLARDRWISVMMVLCVMLLSTFIQLIFPKAIIEMFANAISLLFLSTIVQRPEEFIDVETGARNETSFNIDMKRSLYNNKPIDIIVINIVNNKVLVDVLGIQEYFAVMRQISNMIYDQAQCAEMFEFDSYFLKRGGFCVVFSGYKSDKIKLFSENVVKYMKKPVTTKHIDVNCDICTCLMHCPDDISNFNEFISFINNFFEKSNISDEILLASSIISNKAYSMMMNMETIINRAISQKNLSVYYQPIYSVKEKRFVCAEALVRLKDTEYGFVPPDLFIPVAEKNGTIHKIGRFVFESICKFIGSDEFASLGVDYIDVNLSAIECMNSKLPEEYLNIMEKYYVRPDQIVIEITETAATYEHTVMEKNISALTNAGIALSLDDFGTGYSNMSRIVNLPLKIVKLDKTFTNFKDNPKIFAVADISVKTIKSMDMKIVVEGIENEEVLDKFISLGCDYIQGYYFSKPLPENEYIEFIKDKHNL